MKLTSLTEGWGETPKPENGFTEQDFTRYLDNIGNLRMQNMGLKSLKTCPVYIKGNLDVTGNKLRTLQGAPKEIGGMLVVANNQLTSLRGPKHVGMGVYASDNQLTSLKGFPECDGPIILDGNKLTSLQNVHENIKSMYGMLSLRGNPLRSHLLGVMLVGGLQRIFLDNTIDVEVGQGKESLRLQTILNDHLKEKNSREKAPRELLFRCQEALINAGFEDFAHL